MNRRESVYRGRVGEGTVSRRSRTDDATLLRILMDALPLLGSGLTTEAADGLARLLLRRLDVDAVAVVDRDRVLGRRGVGSAQHHAGDPHRTALTHRVFERRRSAVANSRRAIGCTAANCPLTAAVVAPLIVQGQVVGALKLYRSKGRAMRADVVRTADGLARIFGVYLELADLEAQAARIVETELEACRAQVSPHFLFNTLNAIAALTRTEPRQAHDMLVEFAELFRETLRSHGDVWTLGEELEYVRRYVNLQALRLGERLRVEYAIDPLPPELPVPVLIVQPLVENAIVHGIEPLSRGGRLSVSVRRLGGCIEIDVDDDGVGISGERLVQVLEPGFGTGLGIGLSNVDRRVRGLYGPAFGLRVESDGASGTRASLRVPIA